LDTSSQKRCNPVSFVLGQTISIVWPLFLKQLTMIKKILEIIGIVIVLGIATLGLLSLFGIIGPEPSCSCH